MVKPRNPPPSLDHMKQNNVPVSSPVAVLEALEDMFLGPTVPVPDLEG